MAILYFVSVIKVVNMNDFVTGIDDIGTMTGKCQGWTFVSFDAVFKSEFDRSAQLILTKSRLNSFHGKEFKRKKLDYYVEFLELIRRTLEKSNGFLCSTLLRKNWKDEFGSFGDRLIESAFSNVGIQDDALISASKKISAPLFTYQRLSAARVNGGRTTIDIDSDSVLDKLPAANLIIDGIQIANQIPIYTALKAYGKRCFPTAPLIVKNQINVLPDEASFLIQAADVVGNFALAKLFQSLGKKTGTNDLKCGAFDQVFGEIVDTAGIIDYVKLTGDDIELIGNDAYTFSIG